MSSNKGSLITRQIDTGIGLIVGGIVGWFHYTWEVWFFLFAILVAWFFADKSVSDAGKI